MRSGLTVPPFINQVDRGTPTTCKAPSVGSLLRGRAGSLSDIARVVLWVPALQPWLCSHFVGPASSPTVLFPSRPGGTLPHGRTPHPFPITPGRWGVRTQCLPTPLNPFGLCAPRFPQRALFGNTLLLAPLACLLFPHAFPSITPRHSPVSSRHYPLPVLDRPQHGSPLACHRPAIGGWVAPHHRGSWCLLLLLTWSPRRCVRRTPSSRRTSTVWSEAV